MISVRDILINLDEKKSSQNQSVIFKYLLFLD